MEYHFTVKNKQYWSHASRGNQTVSYYSLATLALQGVACTYAVEPHACAIHYCNGNYIIGFQRLRFPDPILGGSMGASVIIIIFNPQLASQTPKRTQTTATGLPLIWWPPKRLAHNQTQPTYSYHTQMDSLPITCKLYLQQHHLLSSPTNLLHISNNNIHVRYPPLGFLKAIFPY